LKILIVSSYAPEIERFRGDMILEMKRNGHEVIAVAPEPEKSVSYLKERLGIEYRQVYMKRTGKNPFQDLRTLFSLVKIMGKEKPDVVLSYTIKPVIYASLAARFVGVKNIFAMLSGLGSISRGGEKAQDRVLKAIVDWQYKLALKGCSKVFFQNTDDRDFFIAKGLVRLQDTVIINGSGVNLREFKPQPLPKEDNFLFVGRLLKDKGILEYLEAASKVKHKYSSATFGILGPSDTNPTAVSEEVISRFVQDGIVEYYGVTDDVRPYLQKCSVFVLPSYHEGTSRATLEAMATGRPIITTDAPGCRETVIDGLNGFLVPVGDSESLATKMMWMIENRDRAEQMGEESVLLCQEKFDVEKVNKVILETMGLIP
jgi:glycosyltransferase involved in cell wall biosynthesis